MNAPKIAGYGVIFICVLALVLAVAAKAGVLFAISLLAGSAAVAFAYTWAIGAILYQEWWPFRHWR